MSNCAGAGFRHALVVAETGSTARDGGGGGVDGDDDGGGSVNGNGAPGRERMSVVAKL